MNSCIRVQVEELLFSLWWTKNIQLNLESLIVLDTHINCQILIIVPFLLSFEIISRIQSLSLINCIHANNDLICNCCNDLISDISWLLFFPFFVCGGCLEVAKLNTTEWYFFSFRDRKYATGFRTNRATTSGYWKATGKDRVILDPRTREIVGMRKTLVFYKNRAPNGIKTGWIMHEFRLESPHMPPKVRNLCMPPKLSTGQVLYLLWNLV